MELILDQDNVTENRGLSKRHKRAPSHHLYNHQKPQRVYVLTTPKMTP